ncbi:3'-phosphoadenosine 5'-phosphosulfate sulfotransferase [Lignoscripta atroalba]|nr:3'-phosphoadenosine 5'-phosphosulfate sulfotransferase [Lignoscripta atroalba]
MTETVIHPPVDQPHAQQANGQHSLRALCSKLNAQVEAFLQEDVQTERLKRVQDQTRISIHVIQEALKRYSLSEISFSYNGGKDCLVLLILYLAALSTHPSLPALLESIYIVPPHPFSEVDTFVESSSSQYHLSLARYAKDSMKAAFADYLAEKPEIKAIFVGTRRTDPHGADLTHFDMTDHGWPSFMRVQPVIDWHYVEIWTGYTSLGGTTDTHPNPALRVEGSGKMGQGWEYRPAYELEDDGEERLGRDR